MSDMVYKIALAGLLHDVGKFAERGKMELAPNYQNDNAALYQPNNNQEKRYTHQHALYSAAFIERFTGLLPKLDNIEDSRSGNSLINIAAMHHKPETALQWIITQADRLSSGMDRQIFEGDETGTAYKNFRKTRMIPLAEEMLRGEKDNLDSYKYRYPLSEFSPKSVFAIEKEKSEPTDDKTATKEYADLFEKFSTQLKKLSHKDAPILWFDGFSSLWERFTSLIPAATVGKVIPDVSLYDHSKATAAIAAPLYLYHNAKGTLNEQAIKKSDEEKFLLIRSDFFGIQKFIFSEGGSSNKAAAKLLRGRSFAVSLLSELAAKRTCEALNLPPTSLILNAAGKFTIIAPNLPESLGILQSVEKELNRWLIDSYYGEVAIGFASVTASPDDFEQNNFPELWERLVKAGEAKKYRKFSLQEAGVVSSYLDDFDNNIGICPFCGKRPADKKTLNDSYLNKDEASCLICRDHIHLGAKLIKAETMVLVRAAADYPGSGNSLKSPLFGCYQIAFNLDLNNINDLVKRGELIAISSFARAGDAVQKGYAVRFVSGYVPLYTEEDKYDDRILAGRTSDEKTSELIDMIEAGGAKSFHHIAKSSRIATDKDGKFKGTEALGILKADVDRLGKLFACGLPKERLNLSRMATFSRQLDSFFSVYLPSLLSSEIRFQNIYTVFAGGDDLFLIGPWNRIIEFAGVLKNEFEKFACKNKEITISTGITVDKAGIPVPAIAENAETALENAKHNGRDSITIFDETVKWCDFEKLEKIKDELGGWQESGKIGKGLLYQLNEFIAMAKKERQIRDAKRSIDLRDMSCLAWRSKLTYSATRNIGKDLSKEDRQNALDDVVSKLPIWLNDYNGKLKIALWQILYNQR